MSRKSQGPSVSFFAFQDIITSVVGIFVLITLIMIIELISKSETTHSRIEANVEALQQLSSSLEKSHRQLSQQQQDLTLAVEASRGADGSHPEFQEKMLQKQLNTFLEQKHEIAESIDVLEEQLTSSKALQKSLSEKWDVSSAERQRRDNLESKIHETETRLRKILTDDPIVFRSGRLEGRSVVIFDLYPNRVEIVSLETRQRETFAETNPTAEVRAWIEAQDLKKIHILVFVRPNAEKLFAEVKDTLNDKSASFGFDVLGANRQIAPIEDMTREP